MARKKKDEGLYTENIVIGEGIKVNKKDEVDVENQTVNETVENIETIETIEKPKSSKTKKSAKSKNSEVENVREVGNKIEDKVEIKDEYKEDKKDQKKDEYKESWFNKIFHRNKKKKHHKKKKQISYTKKILGFVLISSELQIWASYVLAGMGREQIAENLSQQVVIVILGGIIPYFAKSLIENLSKNTTMFGDNIEKPVIDEDSSENIFDDTPLEKAHEIFETVKQSAQKKHPKEPENVTTQDSSQDVNYYESVSTEDENFSFSESEPIEDTADPNGMNDMYNGDMNDNYIPDMGQVVDAT